MKTYYTLRMSQFFEILLEINITKSIIFVGNTTLLLITSLILVKRMI